MKGCHWCSFFWIKILMDICNSRTLLLFVHYFFPRTKKDLSEWISENLKLGWLYNPQMFKQQRHFVLAYAYKTPDEIVDELFLQAKATTNPSTQLMKSEKVNDGNDRKKDSVSNEDGAEENQKGEEKLNSHEFHKCGLELK